MIKTQLWWLKWHLHQSGFETRSSFQLVNKYQLWAQQMMPSGYAAIKGRRMNEVSAQAASPRESDP